MTYEEALSFIHSVDWRGSKLGLERTQELMEKLGHPEKQMKFIHIAGTNGKGSTAAMLAAITPGASWRTWSSGCRSTGSRFPTRSWRS